VNASKARWCTVHQAYYPATGAWATDPTGAWVCPTCTRQAFDRLSRLAFTDHDSVDRMTDARAEARIPDENYPPLPEDLAFYIVTGGAPAGSSPVPTPQSGPGSSSRGRTAGNDQTETPACPNRT
jgi:hypothetical protein